MSALAADSESRIDFHEGSVASDEDCELCERSEFKLLATKDRNGNDLSTVVCRRCGLIRHQQIPTDKELAAFYAHEYRHAYHGQSEPSAKRILRAWYDGQAIYRRLRSFVRPSDTVFEVGAGLGCTIKAFERAGHRAVGIEPGDEFQSFSRDVLGSHIIHSRLEDIAPTPSYDVVLLVHVLEHLNRPKRALRLIRSLLKPGGRLYIECPNAAAPHAAPGRMFHYAHVYNFTPWTLLTMANRCGFDLVQQLSGPRGKSLMFMFEKGNFSRLYVEPNGFAKSLAAVRRYSTLTYHARPAYAISRIRSLFRLLRSDFLARRRVQRLIAHLDDGERQMNESDERVEGWLRAA